MIIAPHWKLRDYMAELRHDDDNHNSRRDARLPVLLTLMLHANRRLRCWPSTDLLVKETGFNPESVVEARQWLIDHKALELVPFAKREGKEKDLPPRQYVYQLTGMILVSSGLQPYIAMSPETEEDGRPELLHEGEVSGSETLDDAEVSEREISVPETKGLPSFKVTGASAPSMAASSDDAPPDGKPPIGASVFYANESANGQVEVQQGVVEKHTAKKVWVVFDEGKRRCLAPASLHTKPPTLRRQTDAVQDVVLRNSFGISADAPIGKSMATRANDIKSTLRGLAGGYPLPDELDQAYRRYWDEHPDLSTPTQAVAIASMVNAYRAPRHPRRDLRVAPTPPLAPSEDVCGDAGAFLQFDENGQYVEADAA